MCLYLLEQEGGGTFLWSFLPHGGHTSTGHQMESNYLNPPWGLMIGKHRKYFLTGHNHPSPHQVAAPNQESNHIDSSSTLHH